jgi:hypothetical protein
MKSQIWFGAAGDMARATYVVVHGAGEALCYAHAAIPTKRLDVWVVRKAEVWPQTDSKQKGQGPNLPIVKTEGTDAKISGNNVYRIIPVLRADTNKALASLRPKNPIDVDTCKMQGSLSALETIRDNQPNRSPRTTRNFVLLANKSCGNRSRLLLRRNAMSPTREKQ